MRLSSAVINLILTLLFLLLIPFFPLLSGTFTLLTLIVIISLIKKEKQDAVLSGVILLTLIIVKMIYPTLDEQLLVLRTAAILAFLFMTILLLIGPWTRFFPPLMPIYKYRRHLGVTVLLLGLLHVFIVYPLYFQSSLKTALQSIFPYYGFSALLILTWLGLTSWDYLQEKIKPRTWSLIHVVALASFLTLSILFLTIISSWTPHLYFIIASSIFWLFVTPYGPIKNIMKTYIFGWKQLHVLIYVAYFSLILHVLFGVLPLQNPLIKFIFWFLIVIVLGSHALGWILKWREDKKNTINSQATIMDGKNFYLVGKEKDFHEGIGQRKIVNNIPLAIFKHLGAMLAFSDICTHQKGPLHLGKINQGYLVCPWHQWQFSIKDGCGPKEFPEGVPFYHTKVKDGLVYVAIEHPINTYCLRSHNAHLTLKKQQHLKK